MKVHDSGLTVVRCSFRAHIGPILSAQMCLSPGWHIFSMVAQNSLGLPNCANDRRQLGILHGTAMGGVSVVVMTVARTARWHANKSPEDNWLKLSSNGY